MSVSRLHTALVEGGDKPFIIAPSGQWSYTDMLGYVQRVAAVLECFNADRLALNLADSPALVGIMLAAAASGKSLLVLSRDFQPRQIEPLLAELDVDLLISDTGNAINSPCQHLPLAELEQLIDRQEAVAAGPAVADSEILILTSGTTSAPKCVRYQWPDLLDQVGTHPPATDERWLLAYKLNHFAGLQMLSHVLCNRSTLVLPESSRVADAVKAMTDFSVSHVSSTPTFWRFALAIFTDSPSLPALKQITLGSEPVTEDLLQSLGRLFPDSRLVHIYALTEAGSCVSVSDRKPGLPESILQRKDNAKPQFRITDGELEVKTAHGMSGYVNSGGAQSTADDGWFATGDLVKIQDGRIRFTGRRTETINVGGVKVHPLEVENIISAVPGVKLARVYGRDNPVVGQIVAVEIVVTDDREPTEVEADVRQACLSLPRHSRPRSIDIVDSIAIKNYKVVRRGVSPE